MADSTINTAYMILFDRWPGVAKRTNYADMPSAWVTPTVTATYPMGEKICMWNSLRTTILGINGWTTFVYLRLGTQGTTIVAGDLVVPCLATDIYRVSNDATGGTTPALDAIGSPLAAIALSAVTNDYYAWFWCGGVAPTWHAAAVGGTTPTADGVVIGLLGAVTAATGTNETVPGPIAADTTAPIGYTLKDDG